MADKTVTAIASFGGSSGVSGSIIAEIDGEMHLDKDGNERSSFLPGESVYFYLHYDSNVRIIRVRSTDGGDVQRIGSIIRQKTQQITFEHPAHLVDLQYQPKNKPTAIKWYGRASNLFLTGRTLQADLAPCLGDITYQIAAVQYLHRPPLGLTLDAGETFPNDIVIEYEVT